MPTKLLPCPFCGKTPRILYQGRFCTIMHKNCAAGLDIVGTFDREDKAIKAWNTRYQKTCKPICRDYKEYVAHYCSNCGKFLHFNIEEQNYCYNCGVEIEH